MNQLYLLFVFLFLAVSSCNETPEPSKPRKKKSSAIDDYLKEKKEERKELLENIEQEMTDHLYLVEERINEENRSTKKIDLSYKNEESKCLIESIYQFEGNWYIDVDFVIEEQDLETYNWIITNNNPKIRTYKLTKQCYRARGLEVYTGPKKVCRIDFIKEANKKEKLVHWIEANNGNVLELYEPYKP